MGKRAKPGQGKNPKAAKYRGDYHVRSRRITQAAHANPTTRCWRCRFTLAEARAKWGRHVTWHAGHVELNGRLLLAECSHCNIAERNRRVGRTKHRNPTQAPVRPTQPIRTELTW